MKLPLPPPSNLPLPPPPPPTVKLVVDGKIQAVPLLQRNVESIQVTKLAFDKLEVRIGSVTAIITRAECFRLIGMLERTGATL